MVILSDKIYSNNKTRSPVILPDGEEKTTSDSDMHADTLIKVLKILTF